MARRSRYCRFPIDRLVGRKAQPTGLIFVLSSLLLSQTVLAFDENGHRVVAQLMLPRLSEAANMDMQRLFGERWQDELIQQASKLQSELSRPNMRAKQPLQFTLFEFGDNSFDPSKHCKRNLCSVAAVLESAQVLKRSDYDDALKRQALFYLMHYALQIHVPLNCGLIRDEGGQRILLTTEDDHLVSFSWVWNYDLYRRLNVYWLAYAESLQAKWDKGAFPAWDNSVDPRSWALESNQISIEQVYPLAAAGVYDEKMVVKSQQLLEVQLLKAAHRTADLINSLYGEVDLEE